MMRRLAIIIAVAFSGGCSTDAVPADTLMCHNPLDPENAITIQVSGDAIEVHDAHGDEMGVCDFTVCHIRCGNPDDTVTMHVMDQALGFHLAHGDTLGSCSDSCTTLDFETTPDDASVVAGQQLARTYEQDGVNIRAFNQSGTNEGIPIAFDTSNPTGGDVDLGTPSQEYGGPGQGSGGASNDTALGMVLVKAEDEDDDDGDGVIDDPDDQGNGALLQFDFTEPVCIRSVKLLDIDGNETPVLTTRDRSGIRLAEVDVAGEGDNSVQSVEVNACGAYFFEVELDASGAIAELEYCSELPEPVDPTPVDSGDTAYEECLDDFGDTGLGLADLLDDLDVDSSGCGGSDTADTGSGDSGCSSLPGGGFVALWVVAAAGIRRRRRCYPEIRS